MIDLESVLKTAYNRLLRSSLLRKIGVYNGFAVRRPRLFDRTDVFPDYEAAPVDQIERRTTNNDDVVVIGGGLGVSSVYAPRQGATVTAYEALPERIATIKKTIELNSVADNVTVQSGAVETVIGTGESHPTEMFPASELTECDVRVLDCEEAEVRIPESMEIQPPNIVVETHPMYDALPGDVRTALANLGSEVIGAVDEAMISGPAPIPSATIATS